MDSLWGAGVTFWVLLQNCHIQLGHPRSKCHVKGSLQATCQKTLVELGACYRFLNWNQFEYNLNTNAIWIAFEYKTAVSVLMTRGKNWDWKQLSSAPWRGQSQRVPSGLSLWPSQQEKVGEKTPFFPFSHCISKTPWIIISFLVCILSISSYSRLVTILVSHSNSGLRSLLKISRPGIASSKCFSYQLLLHDNVRKFILLGENQSRAEVVRGPVQLTWPTSPLPICKALPFPAVSSFLQSHLFYAQK